MSFDVPAHLADTVAAVRFFIDDQVIPADPELDRALQVFGAEGCSDDTPLGFMYRTARFARIYDGPDEVHVQSVAKVLLKAAAR